MNVATQSGSDILSQISLRHSVRSYTPENIPHATVDYLLHAAVQAPTAMYQEPWAFAVIQNREILRRYSERAKSLLLKQHAVAGSTADAKLSIHETWRDPAFNIFYDAGTLVVICRKSDTPFSEADCWLAAENLMLAAVAEGLGTCCIGLALKVLNTAEARRELGIPEGGSAVAAIIIGVPSGPTTKTARKPPEILRWLT